MSDMRYDGKVAVVTGAGQGLGRSHAMFLASRGAKVVVNDLGGSTDGSGASQTPAQKVCDEIKAAGGTAVANYDSVSSEAGARAIIDAAVKAYGRIDILVNNAGILRDKTFSKMEMSDFRKVVDVHLIGSANVTHACWPIMREQKYGRIVLTSSASGLYGNFGQSNYGAAKAAMMGLMNVLHLEGARDNIRVNTLAPTAATRMTADLLPEQAQALLAPETITPGLLYLVSEDGPSRVILGAGAGGFAQTRIYETEGVTLTGDENTPEGVASAFDKITDAGGQQELTDAFSQTKKYALNAAKAQGLDLDWG